MTDYGRSGAEAPSGHSPQGLSQSPLSQAEPSVPNAAREAGDMCYHGAIKGSYCGYCQGYSEGRGDDAPLTLVASSACPICGQNTPHEHTVIERDRYWKIEPVAEALCAASDNDWQTIPDEWTWPTGRMLCRDFFRWQARFALDLVRPQDRYDEPVRKGMPVHGGTWPLSKFAELRKCEEMK